MLTYHIDSIEGDDVNDGLDVSTPWKTIQRVNSQSFQEGDFILFRRGREYTDAVLELKNSMSTLSQRITLSSYGLGAKPLIQPTSIISGDFDQLPGNVWSIPWTGNQVKILRRVSTGEVYMDERGSVAELTKLGEFFHDTTANILYVYSTAAHPFQPHNPTDDMEVPYSDVCLRIDEVGNLIVNDLHFGLSNSSNISLRNSGVEVLNCLLTHSAQVSIGSVGPDVNDIWIHHNVITEHRGMGVGISHASHQRNNYTVEFNEVSRTCLDTSGLSSSAAIKFLGDNMRNIRIYRNRVFMNGTQARREYSTGGAGIWVDTVRAGEVQVLQNTVEFNQAGIILELTKHQGVIGNIVRFNGLHEPFSPFSHGRGIILWGAADENTIRFNWVYGNARSQIYIGGRDSDTYRHTSRDNLIVQNMAFGTHQLQAAIRVAGLNMEEVESNVIHLNYFGSEGFRFIQYGIAGEFAEAPGFDTYQDFLASYSLGPPQSQEEIDDLLQQVSLQVGEEVQV